MKHTLTLLLLVGCVASPDESVGVVDQSLISNTLKSRSLDGVSYNGVSYNGVSFNGVSFNGVSFNGVSFNGVSFNGVSFNGSALTGVTATGETVSGGDLAGALFVGAAGDGSVVRLRIDDAAPLLGDNADVWAYGVSYETATGGWVPLCAGSVKALAVPGIWNMAQGVAGGGSYVPDPTRFTFACRASTIAKCVELGYKPWLGFADHMAACTRLLRADYCGDGTAYTVNGTMVNIYDGLGVQIDAQSWNIDGEWTPAGARCVGPNAPTRVQSQLKLTPPCFRTIVKQTCGSKASFGTGTLLIDETSTSLISSQTGATNAVAK